MKKTYLSFTRLKDNVLISIWDYDYETSKIHRIWCNPNTEFKSLTLGYELSLIEDYHIFDNIYVRIDVITEAELFIIIL